MLCSCYYWRQSVLFYLLSSCWKVSRKGPKTVGSGMAFPPIPVQHTRLSMAKTLLLSQPPPPPLSTLAHQASLMTLTTLSLHTRLRVKNDPFLICGTKKAQAAMRIEFYLFIYCVLFCCFRQYAPPPSDGAFTTVSWKCLWGLWGILARCGGS